jgi:hypothetical protein
MKIYIIHDKEDRVEKVYMNHKAAQSMCEALNHFNPPAQWKSRDGTIVTDPLKYNVEEWDTED